MTPKQEASIREHGRQLQAIFPAVADMDPVKLCKKLRRIEVKANSEAVRYCNGEIDSDEWDAVKDSISASLGFLKADETGVPVFINGDPRGYALKIDNEWVREHQAQIHRDWGGYGILAPEIDAQGH